MTGQISKATRESERFAHQAVADAVARERARMARELHDGIATDLAGAISLFKVYVESRPGLLTEGGPEENLRSVFEILERALKQVRETLTDLRPSPIWNGGPGRRSAPAG